MDRSTNVCYQIGSVNFELGFTHCCQESAADGLVLLRGGLRRPCPAPGKGPADKKESHWPYKLMLDSTPGQDRQEDLKKLHGVVLFQFEDLFGDRGVVNLRTMELSSALLKARRLAGLLLLRLCSM